MNLCGTSCWWPSRRPSRTLEHKPSICSSSSWSAWRRRNWYVSSDPWVAEPSPQPFCLLHCFLKSHTVSPSPETTLASVVSSPPELSHCFSCPHLMWERVLVSFPTEAHPNASDCLDQMSTRDETGHLLGNAPVNPLWGLEFHCAWELWSTDVLVV